MESQSAAIGPVAANERIEAMDVLRGFALLGILLMNIEAFVGPLMGAVTGLDPALSGADAWVDGAIYVLVQGKFYTLFSLLFGMGFAVMMQRAQQAGRPFGWIYLRRTLGLLAIGLVHALLIWSGDILVSYALIAFVLLLCFRNTPQSRLPKWGLVFALLPGLLYLLFGLLGDLAQQNPVAAKEWAEAMRQQEVATAAMLDAQRAAYGAGSYWEAVAQRRADLGMMLGFILMFGWNVLGMFLLGAWFVRSGAIAQPQAHAALFSRLRLLALPAGLAMMLTSFWLMPSADMGRMDLTVGTAMALSLAGSLLMCLGYVGLLVGGLQSATWAPRLALLAPAGRMALSNYLTQSIVCTLIFYGYGLGYFEELPRAWQLPFAFALWGAQLALSRWWLAQFQFGPAEWLWRAMTYLRLPSMRRVA